MAQTPDGKMARQLSIKAISGPMPSADELFKYEQIIPGAAERFLKIHENIVAEMQKQSSHRRTLETIVISGDGKRAWAGIFCGVTIVVFFGVMSYILAQQGHYVLAGIIAGMDFVSPVGVFIYGTSSRRQERNDRLSDLAKRLNLGDEQ